MVTANAAFWSTHEANMTQVAIAADLAGTEAWLNERRAAEYRDQVCNAVEARKVLGNQSRLRVAAEFRKLKPMSRARAAQHIARKVKLSERRVYTLLTELHLPAKNT